MHSEFVLRPIEEKDLAGLKALALSIKDGMTSLPPEESALEDRINHSLRSFDYRIKSAGADHYLFVLESVPNAEVVGTAGIIARVGGFDPFYTYELKKEGLVHPSLGIDKQMDVLHLKLDHKGPSELCSLSLRPEYRRAGLGQLLSLSRFLFIASFPQRFDERVIAELRGFTDDAGLSPFWEAVGRHFFNQTFAAADFLSGIGQKDFIRDLMPKYPIYVAMLPPEAQAVIGKVHTDAAPALKILLAQGFKQSDEVDIFDAGPLVTANRNEIRTIKNARFGNVTEIRPIDNGDAHIVAHVSLNFRACLGSTKELGEDSVAITPDTARQLNVQIGDRLIYVPLRSK
jgi:arginine N-succinyltransferase